MATEKQAMPDTTEKQAMPDTPIRGSYVTLIDVSTSADVKSERPASEAALAVLDTLFGNHEVGVLIKANNGRFHYDLQPEEIISALKTVLKYNFGYRLVKVKQ